jgi:hypothetical protein
MSSDIPFVEATGGGWSSRWALNADGTHYTVRTFACDEGILVAAEPLSLSVPRGWFITVANGPTLTQDYVAEKLGIRLDHIDTWNLTRLIGAALDRPVALRGVPAGREVR